jgi:hypothetical protein
VSTRNFHSQSPSLRALGNIAIWWLGGALPLLISLLAFASPPVLINEIYYDAPGSDTGFEFVELINISSATASLEGYLLEAGNGSGPDRWRLLWRPDREEVIAPGARLLLGEASVQPAPDRVLWLAMENGPDALRLVAPGGEQDVVGWGDLSYSEYFAGTPAPDVPAGYSLGRKRDGFHTGDNATDFIALNPPTPGAANRPERDVALEPRDLTLVPEIILPEQLVRVSATAVNRGLGPLDAGELRLLLWAAEVPSLAPVGMEGLAAPVPYDSLVSSLTTIDPLEAGDSLHAELSWTPPRHGAYRLALTARIEDDGVLGNHRGETHLRVGVGPLVITEILYAPEPDEPEWVEVRARGATPLDLSRFTLEDATGRAARMNTSIPYELALDSLAILSSDAPALIARYPHLDPQRIVTYQPWPRFNNTASQGGASADRVVLRDERGLVSDWVSYEGGGPTGYSLERRDADQPGTAPWNWGVSALAGGTPLAANSVFGGSGAGTGLELSMTRWRVKAGGPVRLTVSYRLEWERAVVRLSVIDPRGRERSLLHEGPSAARGAIDWDGKGANGKPLPQGAYVVALEARPADGPGRLQLMQPLVLLR